jgi:hypothetical protein
VQYIDAERPLQVREVAKFWRLPQSLETLDPLLGEEDPHVVPRRRRPQNAAEEGIVTAPGVAIVPQRRRPRGQPAWHREPSAHESLDIPSQNIGRAGTQSSRNEVQLVRRIADEGFAAANQGNMAPRGVVDLTGPSQPSTMTQDKEHQPSQQDEGASRAPKRRRTRGGRLQPREQVMRFA